MPEFLTDDTRLGCMLTMVMYVLAVAVVGALLYGLACAVFGRGDELAPLPEATSAAVLPESDVAARDIAALRFRQTVRGYKPAEVDWALDRLAEEITVLRERLATARAAGFVEESVDPAHNSAR
jgi:DivIVA domain-containing protein